MKQKQIDLCPCHSKKKYRDCCQKYHEEKACPKKADLLVRARYSAYALNIPKFIIKTTHSDNILYKKDFKAWIKEISIFSMNTNFKDLKIIDFTEKENMATVTFIATLFQLDQDVSFKEKSQFKKCNDNWLYFHGQMS